MDHIDLKLLGYLQQNAKLSYTELGKRVGLVVSTVNERLKKLQAHHVIRGYTALIAPKALGLDICAFVQVLMSDPAQEAAFVARMDALTDVQECHCITGEFSYLLKVRARDTAHLETFLREEIKTLAGVVRTHTLIALTTSKETPAVPISDAPPGAEDPG